MIVHLNPIGKFMIDLTENMKRLLDTYQEIRPDNFTVSFDTVQKPLCCHQTVFEFIP